MSSNNNGAAEFIKKTFDDIQEMSSLNQIIAGGSLGLATGYVFSRVGKLAAFALGTSVLVLQVAQHTGYIEVKFTKKSKIDQIKKKALKAAEEIGITENNKKNGKIEQGLEQVKKFMQKNITFGASFGGGILIGFSI
jgi:FUN14 domain-containing protein 1